MPFFKVTLFEDGKSSTLFQGERDDVPDVTAGDLIDFRNRVYRVASRRLKFFEVIVTKIVYLEHVEIVVHRISEI